MGYRTIDWVLNRPVNVLHAGAPWEDEYGVIHPGEWQSVPTTAYLEQTTTAEVVVGGEVYKADWLLVVPSDTALGAFDRVEVADLGATFEVVGLPSRPHRAPTTGIEHHVEARLRVINTGAV